MRRVVEKVRVALEVRDLTRDVTGRGEVIVRALPAVVHGARVERVLAANERGQPDSAPPPPFKVPMMRVVDSARLRELEDSAAGR